MLNNKKQSETKVTNEKPISLYPLKFEEALKKILQVTTEKKTNKKN